MSDETKAKEAIKKALEKKYKVQKDRAEKKIKGRAVASLKDLGISEDALKYSAGAIKAIDVLNKGEIEGGINLNKNLELKGKISPREKAIKLLYNKSF